MSKTAKILLILVVIAAAAAGVYYFWKKNQKPAAKPPVNVPDERTPGNNVVSDPSNGLDADIAVNTTGSNVSDGMAAMGIV